MTNSAIQKVDIFHTLHDPSAAIATGQIDGVSSFNFRGSITDAAKDVLRDFTALGNTIPLPLFAGEQLEVVSDNGADTATLNIEGVGADGVAIDPMSVQLNGTTPVSLPIALVSRINILESDEDIDGTVTLRLQGGAATVFAQILPGDQEYIPGIVSIPADKKAVFKYAIFSSKDAAPMGSRIFVKSKSMAQDNFNRGFSFFISGDNGGPVEFTNRAPRSIQGPRDIKVSMIAGDNGTDVEALVSGLIFDTV